MPTPTEFEINQEQLNNFLGPVQGALGGLPVAEQLQDYFLVFQQAGGTGPEIIDETAFFITYMVDSKGNVAKPVQGYPSQYNLIQNFGVGTNVVVRNDASTTLNSQLAGTHPVSSIGRQLPILYTQYGYDTGSHSTSIDWLSKSGVGFDADPITSYFLGAMLAPTQISTDSGGEAISETGTTMTSFGSVEDPIPDTTAAVFNATAGTYTLGNTAGLINLQSLTLQVDTLIRNYASFTITVKVAIQIGGSDVAFKWYTIPGVSPPYKGYDSAGVPYSALNTGNDPLTLLRTTANGTLNGEGIYTVVITRDLGNTSGASTSAAFLSSLTFRVISQNPTPTPPVDTNGTFIGFSTGSSYQDQSLHTWLTASQYVSLGWGNTQNSSGILDLQKSNASGVLYNLSPIEVPFLPQVGDRIRFEYNKATDYFIYDVITPNLDPQNRLKLKINQVIPPSVERENYIIHRTNVDDPAYIILDVNKNITTNDTQNFNGVILPEFPTEELKNNLDQITIDLKERGIITDNEA
tara:strand:+ start:628 stop:2190 length:1563 start_codon:yes stop_codon:yes gene_type:complete